MFQLFFIKGLKFMNSGFLLTAVLMSLAVMTWSCGDKDDDEVVFETGTVTDVEGNVYTTIKIGDQWWMAEDLRTTSFRSGQTIPQITVDDDWASTNDPAYTIYENSDLAPGLLYNYYVVNGSEQIAPEGWHVPTDDEWKILESHLGMLDSDLDETNWRGTDQGDQLKLEGTEGWQFYEGVWGTNSTGFSAYGGSSRFFQGPFGVPGLKGSAFWWSSTSNQDHGWYRYLDYKKTGIFRYFGHPNYGFAIRCVKDN